MCGNHGHKHSHSHGHTHKRSYPDTHEDKTNAQEDLQALKNNQNYKADEKETRIHNDKK